MANNSLKLHTQISKSTIAIGVFIILSAAFMRQVSDFMRLHIGEQRFIVLVGTVLIISGLLFLLFALKHRPEFINILVFTLVLIVGLALCWRIKIPIERVHILEYGILGWLAGRDLFGKKGNVRGIIFACAFAAFIGILDEAFQAILPYRYFDLRDIVFNGLGGVWGVSLYLLGVRDSPLRASSD